MYRFLFLFLFLCGSVVNGANNYSTLASNSTNPDISFLLVKHGLEQWNALTELLEFESYDITFIEGLKAGERVVGPIEFQGIEKDNVTQFNFTEEMNVYGFDSLSFMKEKSDHYINTLKSGSENENALIELFQSDYMGIEYRNDLLIKKLSAHIGKKILVVIGVLHCVPYEIDDNLKMYIKDTVVESDYQFRLLEYVSDFGFCFYVTNGADEFLRINLDRLAQGDKQ